MQILKGIVMDGKTIINDLIIPQGLLLGGIALAFFNVFDEINSATWFQGDYARACNVAETQEGVNYDALKIGNGEWWYVGLLTGAGAVVGIMKIVWTFLLFPEHPFPEVVPNFIQDLHELKPEDPLASIAIICCSSVSIGVGASCGPEVAMGCVGVAIGGALVPQKWSGWRHVCSWLRCVGHGDETTSEEAERDVAGNTKLFFPDLSELDANLCAIDGASAAFGPLFPGQILSTLLIHEVGFLWDDDGKRQQRYQYMETVFRSAVAATIGYAFFVGLEERTFLEPVALPEAGFDVLPSINMKYLGFSAILGIVSGIVGFFGFLCIGVGAKLGAEVTMKSNNLGEEMGLPQRVLGVLVTPLLGGVLLGLLAVAVPLTLGDGSRQTGPVAVLGDKLGWQTLLVTAIAKLVAGGISLGFGFVGGPVFPMLMAGSTLGSLVHQWVPGIPLVVAVPSCMAAVPCAFFPAPFTFTLIISLFFALGGAATSPVFVATLCSSATICGFGILQKVLGKNLDSQVALEDGGEEHQRDQVDEEHQGDLDEDAVVQVDNKP
jgi:H+/Cl- antiporter ClcA